VAFALAMTSGLFAVIVAFVGIAGAIINERYKAHKSRAGVAAVFHAEIAALSGLTATADTVANFTHIAERFEAGEVFVFPKLYAHAPVYGPVFDKHIEHIGLLGVGDAEDVVLFYNYLMGVRSIILNLTSGVWEPSPQASAIMAQQIRMGLGFWHNCGEITGRLLPSLQATTKAKFRPWKL
jgi:hypothetical protein